MIVDEAHALGDASSGLHLFVGALSRRRLIAISATPAADEAALDALAALMRPGIASPRALLLRSRPAEDESVREPVRVGFEPGPDERALYDGVAALSRRAPTPRALRAFRALERLAVASPVALADALDRLAAAAWLPRTLHPSLSALATRARATRPQARLDALARALDATRSLVFTRYRASVDAIVASLDPRAIALHHGLVPSARRAALVAFAQRPDAVLVCTDAAVTSAQSDVASCTRVHFDPPASAADARRRRAVGPRASRDVTLVAMGTIESRLHARLARDDRALTALLDVAPVASPAVAPDPGPTASLHAVAPRPGAPEVDLRAATGCSLRVVNSRESLRSVRAVLWRLVDRRDERAQWFTSTDAATPDLQPGREPFDRFADGLSQGAAVRDEDLAWLATRTDTAVQQVIAYTLGTQHATHPVLQAEATRLGERLADALATSPWTDRAALQTTARQRLAELIERARSVRAIEPRALRVVLRPVRVVQFEIVQAGRTPVRFAAELDRTNGQWITPPCAACTRPLVGAVASCTLGRHPVCASCSTRRCAACTRDPAR